jgi:hypothetical protein
MESHTYIAWVYYSRLRWGSYNALAVIWWMAMVTGLMHATSAGLQLWYTIEGRITMQYSWVSDHLTDATPGAFVHASDELFSVNLGYIVAAFTATEAVSMVIFLWFFQYWVGEMAKGSFWLPWASYMASTPFMVAALLSISGADNMWVQILGTNYFITLNGFALFLVLFRGEQGRPSPGRLHATWTPTMRMMFTGAFRPFILVSACYLYYFIRATLESSPPAFVHAAVYGTVVSMLPFPVVLYYLLSGTLNEVASAFWLLFFSLTSKMYLSWVIFGGSLARN